MAVMTGWMQQALLAAMDKDQPPIPPGIIVTRTRDFRTGEAVSFECEDGEVFFDLEAATAYQQWLDRKKGRTIHGTQPYVIQNFRDESGRTVWETSDGERWHTKESAENRQRWLDNISAPVPDDPPKPVVTRFRKKRVGSWNT